VTATPSPFRPGGQYFSTLASVVAVVIVAGLTAYFFLSDQAPSVEPEPVIEAPAQPVALPPPPEAPVESLLLPPLDESDSLVRDLVSALTSHPTFAAWLIPDNLISMFVVVVENTADGNNPATHLAPLRPTQRFRTTDASSVLSVDPTSYTRYNTHAEIVASINPVGAAELYRTLYPLIAEAYTELGYPDGGFEETLNRALRNLLETPISERDVALVPRATFFDFADEALENLLPVQKQFMGMGPRNVRSIQSSLLDIAREVGVDMNSLPMPTVIR